MDTAKSLLLCDLHPNTTHVDSPNHTGPLIRQRFIVLPSHPPKDADERATFPSFELALSQRSSGATSIYRTNSTRSEDGGGKAERSVEFVCVPAILPSAKCSGTRINSIWSEDGVGMEERKIELASSWRSSGATSSTRQVLYICIDVCGS